jgi:hypothetical protein
MEYPIDSTIYSAPNLQDDFLVFLGVLCPDYETHADKERAQPMHQLIAVPLAVATLIISGLILAARAYRLATTEAEHRATLRGTAIATPPILLSYTVGSQLLWMVAP